VGALALPPAVPGIAALFAYTGAGRDLVAGLKYRNGRAVLGWLGVALARLVPPGATEVVTWAPTHPERRRARGYDQAALLARAVAQQLAVPCSRLLRRTDRAGPQTGRPRAGRLAGPAFVATRAVPRAVLLVDDVVTTGATLRGAAQALEAAGARQVVLVAAAATPRPGPRERPPMLRGAAMKG
jgi:predicted amidophosphoribosyltransferase